MAAALLVAAAAVGVTIRFNSFVPWGTDSGAYITAAHHWAEADLFSPASFVFWASWDGSGRVEAPLGHRPGPEKGTLTGVYPLGYPLLMAAAIDIGGPLAAYVVAPLLLGVLALCAFALGRQLSTAWAGLVAAVLMAATPVALAHALIAMSDVPAAAFWATAWVMSLRVGSGAAVASGLAAAMAMMIRPNLAPLAIVIGVTAALSEGGGVRRAVRRLILFGLTGSIGPLMVMWSQAVLYGDPLESGYVQTLDELFSASRIPINALVYPRTLIGLHSPLALLGLAAVPVFFFRVSGRRKRHDARPDPASAADSGYARPDPAPAGAGRYARPDPPRVVAASATALVLANYTLYLPFLTYEGWPWLRFQLPAMLALFVLLAGVLDRCRLWLARRQRWLGVLAIAPAAVVLLTPANEIRLASVPAGAESYLRLVQAGHYLRAALPRNAVILTYLQGGAMAHYTGRPIVRLDLIAPDSLGVIVDDLRRHGLAPVLVLDVAFEGEVLHDKFKTSQYVDLDWPPRAEFTTSTTAIYYDPADRRPFLNGERWAVDQLLWPPRSDHRPVWADLRVPGERVAFPPVEELRAFRATLETIYREHLGRPPIATSVHPHDSATWLRRYLRFRVNGCEPSDAEQRVFQEIDTDIAQPLCRSRTRHAFPARDETLTFRRALEAKFAGRATAPAMTAVDLEGDAVWMQEYLIFRTKGCSHSEASTAVLDTILRRPTPECTAGR